MAAAAAASSSFIACQQNQKLLGGLRISPLAHSPLRTSSSSRRGCLTIRCAVAEPKTLETVQKIIASQLSVEEAVVKPESKFADLGADSLDTVEIMMNLEESFKISLGEEGAEKIATVQDAADMIQEMISKSS